MKAPISIQRASRPLPCPMVFLHDAAALAHWHSGILTDAYDRGERTLTLCVFPALSSCPAAEGAAAIFAAAETFLLAHSDVEHLTLLCEGDKTYALFASLLENTPA